MGFILQVVFAHIYTFSVDIMSTEFARQNTTGRIEVNPKLLGSVFWSKGQVLYPFFTDLQITTPWKYSTQTKMFLLRPKNKI